MSSEAQGYEFAGLYKTQIYRSLRRVGELVLSLRVGEPV